MHSTIILISRGSTAQNNTAAVQDKPIEIPAKIYSAGGIYLEYPAHGM
ncbi:MAG: hypothetical protein PQ964_01215 [Methanobacteriaceae archaeon]